MTGVACVRCGKTLGAKDDAERKVCKNVSPCARRALSTLKQTPYLGFDPAAAYANAPKMGDT